MFSGYFNNRTQLKPLRFCSRMKPFFKNQISYSVPHSLIICLCVQNFVFCMSFIDSSISPSPTHTFSFTRTHTHFLWVARGVGSFSSKILPVADLFSFKLVQIHMESSQINISTHATWASPYIHLLLLSILQRKDYFKYLINPHKILLINYKTYFFLPAARPNLHLVWFLE